MIKPQNPTDKYPLGGLKVIVSVWKGSKREPVIDYRPYLDRNTGKIDKRAAQDAAELLEKQLKVDLKKERDQQNIPTGLLRTFEDYAKIYQSKSGPHATNSYIRDMVDDFGSSLPDQWPSKFEKFIKDQDGRKVKRAKFNKETGKVELMDTDKEISVSVIKSYRRYFKAVCGFATSENLNEIDRLKTNMGKAFYVGKAEARTGVASDKQRAKIFEVIGNDFEWFLPPTLFACSMPTRPEDLFGYMFPIDESEDFWKRLPKARRKDIGLTWDKINQVQHSICYLPKKTWETEKYAIPLILPNVAKYIYNRIGDDECQFIFCRPGLDYLNEDTGKRYGCGEWTYQHVWKKVREKAEVTWLQYYEFTRHDAVNFLRSNNVSDSTIMQYGGWSTRSILDNYDSRNPERAVRANYDNLAKAVEKENKIMKDGTNCDSSTPALYANLQ